LFLLSTSDSFLDETSYPDRPFFLQRTLRPPRRKKTTRVWSPYFLFSVCFFQISYLINSLFEIIRRIPLRNLPVVMPQNIFLPFFRGKLPEVCGMFLGFLTLLFFHRKSKTSTLVLALTQRLWGLCYFFAQDLTFTFFLSWCPNDVLFLFFPPRVPSLPVFLMSTRHFFQFSCIFQVAPSFIPPNLALLSFRIYRLQLPPT